MQISPTTLDNLLLIFSIICLSQVAIASSSTCDHGNVIFSFPATFNKSNCESGGDLLCMGAATLADGFLNLTKTSANSSSTSDFNSIGRVLYRRPVQVWPASFCTTFSFKIFPRFKEFTGDGMAFVMAQDNNPSPLKSFGSYLGLQDPLLEGNNKFQQLAVEMDTFKNTWDVDGNHIAIDTQSVMKSLTEKTLNSSNIELKSGKLIRVKVEYDGWTKMLQIYVGYSGNPLTSFLNYSLEMSMIVPSQVYLGFTASSGILTETHYIHDWIFTSTILPYNTIKQDHHHHHHKKKKRIILLAKSVIPIVVGLVLFAVIALLIFAIRRRAIQKRERIRKMEELEKQYGTVAPRKFTYKQLAKATKNFSKDNLLGTGGFGSVYKGHIVDPPQTIAVKKISSTSQQGEKEYLAEICTIGRLRHRNILQLQGWSHENNSLLLVYDFMMNKSLNEFITGNRNLDWLTRHKILTGLASALLYLHEEYDDPVVHRDVKPSNVMLDTEFNPRLGDFGLARLLKNTTAVTTTVAGTLGYMAPEVSYTAKATTESDVYSFGVVALEVVCGKRFTNLQGETCLVDYAWDMYTKGTLAQCVDPRLGEDFDEEEAVRIISVALACLHLDSNMRPKMRKVVTILLNSDEPLMELPTTRPRGVYVSFYGFSNPPTMSL